MRFLPICAAVALLQAPAAPPDSEIFLAPLSTADGALTVGQPVNITNSPGYDNQPSFTSDGRHISVIRVEAGGTQRLWRFTMEGSQPELVLADVKPVGYHAWADDHTLVLFVLGQPATLQLADAHTGKSEILVTGVGRSIQRVPRSPGPGDRATVSFVERVAPAQQSAAATLRIRELDPATKRVTPLVDAVDGAAEADCAWTPEGTLLMADKDVLYAWHRADPSTARPAQGSEKSRGTAENAAQAWRRVADLAALGVHGVSRLAVSPKGDRIAFVALAR
jgi:hypothetical protein